MTVKFEYDYKKTTNVRKGTRPPKAPPANSSIDGEFVSLAVFAVAVLLIVIALLCTR